MKQAIAQFDQVRAKYGGLPSELLGYSRGGNMAMNLGDLRGVKTTTFNPFVGGNQIKSKSNVEHTVFRTTEDPVSTLLGFTRHKSNFKVSSIRPIVGLHSPLAVHELANFTSQGPRQPGAQESMMIEAVRKGQQKAAYETLDMLLTGKERGQTFTEVIDDFSKTNGVRRFGDVTEDGSLGPRMHKESPHVRQWVEVAGGEFTPAERQHLETTPARRAPAPGPEQQAMGIDVEPLTQAQIDHVAGLRPEQRATFMGSVEKDFASHQKALTATAKPHEEIIRGIMPKTSSVATGIISGFAAHAVMEGIDPDHHLHPVASEAVEGAVSGAMGAGMMAALGGSVAAGPEVLAGAAAYVAGAESQKAITGALLAGGMDEEGAEAVGGVSGGAIGGVTAIATGVGASILSDVLFGTTLGTAIGGPVGALLGAGIGATLGAVTGGAAYIAGRLGREAQEAERQPPTLQELAQSALETTDAEERARLERMEADMAMDEVEEEEDAVEATVSLPSSAGHAARTIVLGDSRAAAAMAHAGPVNEARRMHDILYAAQPPAPAPAPSTSQGFVYMGGFGGP
ncbi:hypothetical protein OAO87_01630 [bacterium]|nr:hypothetical protein [bacterium]